MTDFLLELSKNPTTRSLVKSLGLPIPMPQTLRRAREGYVERPLADQPVLFGAPGGALTVAIGEVLVEAGADVAFVGDAGARAELAPAAEAFGRPVRSADPEDGEEYAALVLDASDVETPADLRALWDFFHPTVRGVARCGRIVVVGRPADGTSSPAQAAARQALDGFVRSVAKEVGKRGTTANLLVVPEGAEDRVAGPLRFLLSANSAYVSGQPLRLSSTARATTDGSWQRPLDGKTALVTGAARGIGRQTAMVLAREGARVVCLDRPEDEEACALLCREIGGEPLGIDLGADDAGAQVVAAAKRLGGFDIVVHNAGVTRDRTLANMKPEYWDLTLGVNLGAPAHITAALLDAKAINAGGRVVCLSSTSGIAGNMGQTNYGAAKAGIIGFVRALAPKVGRRGITVNAVAPGFIETRMTAAMPTALREVARRLNSLGQGGRPVDVGEAVAFLASPQASGVTGQVLRVCGQAVVGA